MHNSTRIATSLCTAAAATLLASGCAQVTVTANTVVDGTARVADATTNAVDSTFNFTTDTTRRADAQTHQARLAFVKSELNMLKREAAAGNGERLDALAWMMAAEDTQAFERMLQHNYATVFDGAQSPEAVLERLYMVAGTPPDMQRG